MRRRVRNKELNKKIIQNKMATTKSTLFEYAVVWHPNEIQEKDGKKSTLIGEPKCMLAREEKAVFMTAVSLLPNEYKDQLDQIDVIVRPF